MAQTTLVGPDTDHRPFNTTDENAERGWSPRHIIASINTMFTELYALLAATAGTVTASLGVVVDSNKDIGTFRNLRTTRLILGSSATSDATAGARTYTAAEILGGIIVRDPNGAGRSDVLPTAALLVAAIPGATIGDTIECYIVNGADAAETITIGAGAGGGFDANQTAASRVIPQNTSKMLTIRLTNVTAASEAYVAYL